MKLQSNPSTGSFTLVRTVRSTHSGAKQKSSSYTANNFVEGSPFGGGNKPSYAQKIKKK